MPEETRYDIGDDVFTTSGPRGDVVDVKTMSDGRTKYAVEDANGRIRHYSARALRKAPRDTP